MSTKMKAYVIPTMKIEVLQYACSKLSYVIPNFVYNIFMNSYKLSTAVFNIVKNATRRSMSLVFNIAENLYRCLTEFVSHVSQYLAYVFMNLNLNSHKSVKPHGSSEFQIEITNPFCNQTNSITFHVTFTFHQTPSLHQISMNSYFQCIF